MRISSSYALTSHPSGGTAVRRPSASRARWAGSTSSSRIRMSTSFSEGGPPRAHALRPPPRAYGTSASRSAAATRLRQSSRCSESAFDDTSPLYPLSAGGEPLRSLAGLRPAPQDRLRGVVGREEQLDSQFVERD